MSQRSLPWFRNSQYHCNLHRTFQTWLL